MEYLVPFIIATFTFGSAIFYCLSTIEFSVLKLAFSRGGNGVSEADIRFVHEALKRLTPLLPPSNGFVILFGTVALILQAVSHGWSWQSLVVIIFYWGIHAYIIFFGKIAVAVKNVRSTDSKKDDLRKVTGNVRHLVIQHHLGLLANFGVVILEFILFV